MRAKATNWNRSQINLISRIFWWHSIFIGLDRGLRHHVRTHVRSAVRKLHALLSRRCCTAAAKRRPEPVQDRAAPVHTESPNARALAERGLRVSRAGRLHDPRHEAADVPRDGLSPDSAGGNVDASAEDGSAWRIAHGCLAARQRTAAF